MLKIKTTKGTDIPDEPTWAPWIETAGGLHYHFQEPTADEIDIRDIALALSNKCRFSGHTQFYSVAEHSVCVAYRLPPALRLAGLLHDAAEAYLGDIPSPLKAVLPDYKALEKLNEQAINAKFNIELNIFEKALVKKADTAALFTEAYYLLPSKGKDWAMFTEGEWEVEHEFKPANLPPVYSYAEFMRAYEEFSKTIALPKQLELFNAS